MGYKINSSFPKNIQKSLKLHFQQIHNLAIQLIPWHMTYKGYNKSKPVSRNIYKNELYDDIRGYLEFLQLVAEGKYKKAYKVYWAMDTFPREFICEHMTDILNYVWNGQPYE